MERLHEGRGRQIEALAPKEERFSKLEEGRDYDVVALNPYVKCDHQLGDFAYFVNSSAGDMKKTVEAPHWRTMVVENVNATAQIPFAKEPQAKNPYFAVSTKGVGYLKPSLFGM